MAFALSSNPYIIFIGKLFLAWLFSIVAVFLAKHIAVLIKNKILSSQEWSNDSGDEASVSPWSEQIANLVEDIVYYFLIIIIIFIAFQIIWFDVWLILGGISFGVWLAFREVLGNMIAWIFLLTMKEIKLGDVVIIHGPKEYFGTIEEITIRTTAIRTFDLKQVIVPNILLIDCPIQTYSAEEIVKLTTTIGIHYDSDLAKACSVITAWVNSCPFILNPTKTQTLVGSFDESCITLVCHFFVNPRNGRIQDQLLGYVNHVIVSYCKVNGIVIPYPHRVLVSQEKPRFASS